MSLVCIFALLVSSRGQRCVWMIAARLTIDASRWDMLRNQDRKRWPASAFGVQALEPNQRASVHPRVLDHSMHCLPNFLTVLAAFSLVVYIAQRHASMHHFRTSPQPCSDHEHKPCSVMAAPSATAGYDALMSRSTLVLSTPRSTFFRSNPHSIPSPA